MSERTREELVAAIAALDAQRPLLGDAVVDAALGALRKQLDALEPPAVAPSVELDAERRTVTVMFADVSGFTALSERLDAEQVRSRMNACFNDLVPVVERYGGTVDKFIGDVIMALFGAPVAHENDPERALRAALDMQRAITSFNTREGTSLGLHFGINTGPVVAGSVGADARQQYSVMGDAVNLAARLEDASESGEILVGPETYRLTSALFEFGAPRTIAVKGKSDAITVRSLMAVRAAVRGSRPLDGLQSPLVGRDEELSELRRAFGALRQGRGGVVALRGDAGVGKSRLVREARQSLPASVVWAEGRGLALAQGTAYGMARDLLYDLLDVTVDASSSRIGDALAAAIARWCPDRIGETLPYLLRLVDLPVGAAFQERLATLSGEVLQARMVGGFVDYVHAMSRHAPLVLAWEDLHWADPSSLRLLEALLQLAEQAAVVVLMSYRPDERGEHVHDTLVAPFAGSRRVVDLRPLTRAQSDEVIHHLLDTGLLPAETRRLVLDRTEGNPFFIEEVVRGLIDAGQADTTQDATALSTPDVALSLPTTLQGVIMARLDRLPSESRSMLQTASVIGRHFQERVLAHVMGADAGRGRDLDACLEELQRRDFVHTRPRPPLPAGRAYGARRGVPDACRQSGQGRLRQCRGGGVLQRGDRRAEPRTSRHWLAWRHTSDPLRGPRRRAGTGRTARGGPRRIRVRVGDRS